MKRRPLENLEEDLQRIRFLLKDSASPEALGDFEEVIQLPSVRQTVRLWEDDELQGVAYVDDYCNLWFVIRPAFTAIDTLAAEMVQWGAACIRKANPNGDDEAALDCVCEALETERIRLLEASGFTRQEVRSLKYEKRLDERVSDIRIPEGYTIRCAAGELEVDALVALHRAAFETDQMTTEYRLAMMRAPGYRPDLDLVAVAPDGSLAAFCVGGVEEDFAGLLGTTDPIGTHPEHRRKGLGQAVVSAALRRLQAEGIRRAGLGTSSDNIAMQRLAESLGFEVVSEKVWFSLIID